MTAHNPSVEFTVNDSACAVTDRVYSRRDRISSDLRQFASQHAWNGERRGQSQ